ncbi:hypothetical protein [Candidiatus Paracoxiella cheracis]|uniref:hypothetical protein n=1 Tax=Candidiatus Paracoxiella cheracis TaxID=3405120 RepID=UPI003BF530B6
MKIETPLIPSWVHSLNDYQHMFALTDRDLAQSILDYPAGISSFNAEMYERGYDIISGDPHYDLTPLDMSKHADNIIQHLATHLHEYADRIQGEGEKTLENIVNAWNHYAQIFVTDYSQGKLEGRYRAAKLPALPFADFEFELALCPDLLFRNKEASPEAMVAELCRVAHEVPVFPLLDAHGEVASALGTVMLNLQQSNFGVEVREVPYKLQKGSNAMLRISAKACTITDDV